MSHRMSGMAPAQFCVPSESVLLSRLREHRTTRFSKLCRLFRTKTDADESRLLDVLERLEKKEGSAKSKTGGNMSLPLSNWTGTMLLCADMNLAWRLRQMHWDLGA